MGEEQEEKTELDLVSDVGRCLLALEDVAQAAGEKGNDQAELVSSQARPSPLLPLTLVPPRLERLDSKEESR